MTTYEHSPHSNEVIDTPFPERIKHLQDKLHSALERGNLWPAAEYALDIVDEIRAQARARDRGLDQDNNPPQPVNTEPTKHHLEPIVP